MSAITADEIIAITDYFGATWPWAEWSKETMAVWIDGLSDENLAIDGALAMQAARICAKRWERPGSMAEFLAEYRNQAERHQLGAKNRRELEAGEAPKDRRRELIALMRTTLATPRPHDHRNGWRGCPTCLAAVQRDHQHLADHCPICMYRRAELGPPLPLPTPVLEDA